MIEYWERMEEVFRVERARMHITYHLGAKPARDRVIKPLAEVNKELSICRDAIQQFN